MSQKGASSPLRGLMQLTAALLALCGGCVATAVSSPDSVPLRDFLARSRGQRSATYRCRVGDQLTTRFFFNPQLDQDSVVRPDGKIALKLVGDMQAAGKSAQELSSDISRAYAPLFNKSTAVVIVRETTGYRVFTAGQLNNPGQISLVTGAKTVLESLAVSGGVTEEGTLSHVYLIRKLPNERYPIIAELNLKEALSGEDPAQDVELMPDDFVFVPNSSAANLNLALQQYFYRNLNFGTGVGLGVGFAPGGSTRTNNTINNGRVNTAPNAGTSNPSSQPMTAPRSTQPMQTMPITPARP